MNFVPFCSQMFLKSSLHVLRNMRTKGQHRRGSYLMFTEIKAILTRSHDTILSDLAGVLSLAVLTMGMLCLPGIL